MRRWVFLATWAARDFLRRAGVALLILTIIYTLVSWVVSRDLDVRNSTLLISAGYNTIMWLCVIGASAGLVNHDWIQGYYRNLFSRPISPVGYYLLRWAVNGLGFLLFLIVLGLGVKIAHPAVPFGWSRVVAGMLFFCVLGAVTFTASTLFSKDWLIAGVIYLLDRQIGAYLDANSGHALLVFAKRSLPPFDQLDFQSGVEPTTALGALAYGAVILAIGSFIIANRKFDGVSRAWGQ